MIDDVIVISVIVSIVAFISWVFFLHKHHSEYIAYIQHSSEQLHIRMQSPGFQGAPISKILLFFTIGSSIIANLADVRRNISLPIDVHTLQSKQLWRLFAWPIAYINTTDVFCASLTIYSFRCLERVWGSRKLLVSHIDNWDRKL